MYNLYIVKEKCILKIKKVKSESNRLWTTYEETPKQFNDVYWVCSERKPLKELANKIKAEWLQEAEERVEIIKNIKP